MLQGDVLCVVLRQAVHYSLGGCSCKALTDAASAELWQAGIGWLSEPSGWAQVVKTLEGGADHAYSAAAFNNSGSLLATVGAYPDFMLTLWDWAAGKTLLRSKAFSQEVFTVSFSPYSSTSLVTSGG